MIISNGVNMHTTPVQNTRVEASAHNTERDAHGGGYDNPTEENQSSTTSSKVITESDGSTVMQYTSVSPGGAIMRKHVTLHDANANTTDPFNPSPMLRHRTEAYEGMMQIF